MAEMGDLRVVDVLLSVAKDPTRPEQIRGQAIWDIKRCLVGLPPEHVDWGAKKNDMDIGALGVLIAPKLPEAYASLAKPMDLPAFKITGLLRQAVLEELAVVLGSDPSAQVRALTVCALQDNEPFVVAAIEAALEKDTSSWVRAWCAVSLSKIGGEEARKILDLAKQQEKDPEVLLALRGERMPRRPELGIPKKSILEPRP
jgi:HEAT repeat protein